MIRADWTPLWAADASTGKALGQKQARCLEMLKERPRTRAELREAGIGVTVTDALLHTWPPLIDYDKGEPQRYHLAAPQHLHDLAAVLAAIREHRDPFPGSYPDEQPPDAVRHHHHGAALDHLLNTRVIGSTRGAVHGYTLNDPPWQAHPDVAGIPKRSRWPHRPCPPGCWRS